MNLAHLHYFLAMMETGSVSRAAAICAVTQPTLSVALKRLEEEFGARLFAPDGRGLRPLPAAKRLERHVRAVERALADARRELKHDVSRSVRIGVLVSLAQAWLPALTTVAHGHVEIAEALADELNGQVARGKLDLALTVLSSRSGLRQQVLLREPYCLFVGPMHEFAALRRVRLTDLHRQPFVLRQCCEQLDVARRMLQAAGVHLKVVAKTRQEATAAALVVAGIGVTLAPRSWGEPGAKAIEVSDLALERVIGVVWKVKENRRAAVDLAAKLQEFKQAA